VHSIISLDILEVTVYFSALIYPLDIEISFDVLCFLLNNSIGSQFEILTSPYLKFVLRETRI
jgi:hypothetical protein